jgi:hypothetical protein
LEERVLGRSTRASTGKAGIIARTFLEAERGIEVMILVLIDFLRQGPGIATPIPSILQKQFI